MPAETPACPSCQRPLERLGGTRTKLGAAPEVEIVHWECRSCGKRWVHHSAKGWRETDRDLSS